MCEQLEATIGYTFADKELLRLALTHRSFLERAPGVESHNQRLEYLGDAVLQLCVSTELYRRFPRADESDLSQGRAALVCEKSLAACAQEINLGAFLRLGHGEEHNGARSRPSMLCDTIEALIGAMYLDGGAEPAFAFILRLLEGRMAGALAPDARLDVKTALVMALKEDGEKVAYSIVGQNGPDHARVFVAQVTLEGRVLGEGSGPSKKEAEKQAARAALAALKQA
nr:ribonuclease III [Maliibacterium massiliense]